MRQGLWSLHPSPARESDSPLERTRRRGQQMGHTEEGKARGLALRVQGRTRLPMSMVLLFPPPFDGVPCAEA